MRIFIACFIVLIFFNNQKIQSQVESPYETDLWVDGAWITAGLGLSTYGLILIKDKDPLEESELATLSDDDVIGFDRWAAGNYSENSNKLSDIPFYTSFTTPFLLLFDKNTRGHAGQLSVLLIETMATTSSLFTITAGLVDRKRPLVYAEDAPVDERIDKDSQRSFYSGHVAASAAASFFAAKVFSDFFPNSKAKPYIWAGAALIPAIVGYYRLDAGKHFLSDNLLGYAIGAATGILVPELHKKKNKSLSFSPQLGVNEQTLRFAYRF